MTDDAVARLALDLDAATNGDSDSDQLLDS